MNTLGPKPTYYLPAEGSEWIPWHSRVRHHVVAIRFDNDTIFDLTISAWRPYVDPIEARKRAFERDLLEEMRERQLILKHTLAPTIVGGIYWDTYLRALRPILDKYLSKETKNT